MGNWQKVYGFGCWSLAIWSHLIFVSSSTMSPLAYPICNACRVLKRQLTSSRNRSERLCGLRLILRLRRSLLVQRKSSVVLYAPLVVPSAWCMERCYLWLASCSLWCSFRVSATGVKTFNKYAHPPSDGSTCTFAYARTRTHIWMHTYTCIYIHTYIYI